MENICIASHSPGYSLLIGHKGQDLLEPAENIRETAGNVMMELGKLVLRGEEGPEQCRGWSLLLWTAQSLLLHPSLQFFHPSIHPYHQEVLAEGGWMSKQVPSHHFAQLISPSQENPKLDQPAQPGLQGLNQQKPPEPGVLGRIETLTLQHRNKPVELGRSWEGNKELRRKSWEKSCFPQGILGWEKDFGHGKWGKQPQQGRGWMGTSLSIPSPGVVAAPPFPPRMGARISKVLLTLSFGVFLPLYSS